MANLYIKSGTINDKKRKCKHELSDITPNTKHQTLGIKSASNEMIVFIKKKISVQFKKTFSNSEDFQKLVLIEIFEGEQKIAKENNLFGLFYLMHSKLRGNPKFDLKK